MDTLLFFNPIELNNFTGGWALVYQFGIKTIFNMLYVFCSSIKWSFVGLIWFVVNIYLTNPTSYITLISTLFVVL